MALTSRPPVVAILGHVDHGKTSLLDVIRKTKVAAGEAGGITQHIGAYQAEHQGKKITFIDTPGHAAFSKMRSRGAHLTDIVILVVAINDGVKPQTIESIKHIQEAKVPCIVAINKVDLEGFYPEVVKAQLAEHGLMVQGFGGDIEAVELSAKTGKGVDKLLETILLTAELHELQADPQAPLQAVIIEAVKDQRSGPIATVIVQQGTLHARDEVFTPTASGKVKRMTNASGQQLKDAPPSTPVEILGFTEVPMVGEVVRTQKEPATTASTQASSEFAMSNPFAEETPHINVILRSDTVGTLQAIEQSLTEETKLISSAVGAITESDILLAETTGSQIVGFNVQFPKSVQQFAESHGVKVKVYSIIYDLLEYLQKQVLKLMEPTIDEEVLGEAEVLQIFDIRGERIAGSKVTKGQIKKTDLIHLRRNGEIIADPRIKSLMHGKEEIDQVKMGEEFGVVFTRFSNLQVGDVIVAFTKVDE